jgi:hypothetical protein
MMIRMKTDNVGRIHSSMYHQCRERGFATPVDVLMDIGVLRKQDYENWRNGGVDYLERVCQCNLHMLSEIMKEVRSYARKNDLKPSETVYKQWGVKKKHGKKKVVRLRFSKTGNPGVERGYSTHYIDSRRIAELKEERMAKDIEGENDYAKNENTD